MYYFNNMVFGVCDGSILGDAVKLIVSRKGTINGFVCERGSSRVAYTKNLTISVAQ